MIFFLIRINDYDICFGVELFCLAYSMSKMSILRDDLGFDGVVCTDWGVTSTPPEQLALGGLGMAWGMENATDNERHLAILDAGGDMFGGNLESGLFLSFPHLLCKVFSFSCYCFFNVSYRISIIFTKSSI